MTSVEQEKINRKKVKELRTGERTLLHEAHELVINEEFEDLPEAIDFITDQEQEGSLMNFMVMEEAYEECAQLIKDKKKVMDSLWSGDLDSDK
jgi:hypothetical protein